VTERPYEKDSTPELFEKKIYTEEAIAEFERERADFVRRAGGLAANSSWIYEDEDYTGPSRTIEQLNKELAEINAELLERGRVSSGNGPRGAEGNLVAVACGCQPPRRFELPGRVYDIGAITCENCGQPFKLT
jgi:hypothetical protein